MIVEVEGCGGRFVGGEGKACICIIERKGEDTVN